MKLLVYDGIGVWLRALRWFRPLILLHRTAFRDWSVLFGLAR
jgi:hypothetical protein